MAEKSVSLTFGEKRVAKALLAKKWRNQDIQALINYRSDFITIIDAGQGVPRNACCNRLKPRKEQPHQTLECASTQGHCSAHFHTYDRLGAFQKES